MGNVIYLGPSYALTTARDVLEPRWPVVGPEPTQQSVGAALANAVAVLDASMLVRFDRAILDLGPGLRVMATATTGADHIDGQALTDRSIPLFTLAGERELLHQLTPAAEHSWLLLMSCARRIRAAMQHVLEGKWRREDFPGIMLKGRTLGVIGCGRIGSWMTRYGKAFDMEVIGHDPFVKIWPEHMENRDLDSLLRAADFVSVHVPLNKETKRMLGKREFSLMKPGVVLVNTSRGGITDEGALLAALVEGHLGAVALDVLDGEPAIDCHPLVKYAQTHDNLIITPHIGGHCPDAVKLVVRHAARRIVSVLSVDPIIDGT